MIRISGAVYGKRTYGSVRAKKTGNYSCFLATRFIAVYLVALLPQNTKQKQEFDVIAAVRFRYLVVGEAYFSLKNTSVNYGYIKHGMRQN
jgi:hypothetical protein